MGVENLPHITAKLIENGRPATTPAAVIRWGTKPEQRVLETNGWQSSGMLQSKGWKPPAIFLVGEVAALRQQLAWFDTKPLFGKTVLVTRAREQASALTNELEKLGARCIEAFDIKIVEPESYQPLDDAFKSLHNIRWVIFTSANGVERFFERLWSEGYDCRTLGNAKVAAIGSQTAAKLKNYGIIADIVPTEFRAEGIVDAFAGRNSARYEYIAGTGT